MIDRLMLRRFTECLLAAMLFAVPVFAQQDTAPSPSSPSPAEAIWDLQQLSKIPAVYPADDLQQDGVHGLFYEGLPYRGMPTRVFAWVGFPDVPHGTKVPGIVLVHGGGGTAFASWVRRWTARGYAAIAMDNCGGLPVQDESQAWQRHEHSGPRGWGGWDQLGEPEHDQWTYHAVADIVLAHSLLRSFPQVDAERTGITGISWGGYLTCIAAGTDQRFRFAAPVYGCGFTDENGFAPQLAACGPEAAGRWMNRWDPSVYLASAQMPMLWVNGSNDAFYTFNAMQKSYRLPTGDRTLCVRLRMPHGHGDAGEGPQEIQRFADSVLAGGPPLARITAQGRDGNTVWATFDSPVPIKRAELNFTVDTGRWQDRHWDTIPATIQSNRISATVPDAATVVYLNLFDADNCVVSTEHEELVAR